MCHNADKHRLLTRAVYAALAALHFLAPRLQAGASGAANTTLTPLLVIDAKSSGAPFGTLDSCVLDSSGNLLVTDKRRMVIHVLNPITGKLIRTIGAEGSGALQFDQPNGIAVDDQGRIFIAEQTNKRVQVLNRDYTFAGFFGVPGAGAGQFEKPMGIAADDTGRIYVTDENLSKVVVFDRVAGSNPPQWRFKFEFAHTGVGKIDGTESIAIDRALQRIYLSDEGQRHVKVYDLQGGFLKIFGSSGAGLGQFSPSGQPEGVAIDENHYIYVNDEGGLRINVYRPDYTPAAALQSTTPFKSADGVHLSEKLDRFFIVDQGNDFVQVFDLNEMKALFSTAVEENRRGDLPADFHLSQNYPNPFDLSRTAATYIEVALPADLVATRALRLEIVDLLGRVVRTYSFPARGLTAIAWDGKNENGVLAPAGVYGYRLTNGDVTSRRRLVLLH
jgi:DNA-binding beta-propeller fold protein YncE